jgi:uncharacterized membrane protein YjjB (DUF3815 family)
MTEELIRIVIVLISSTIATIGIIMMYGIDKSVLAWALVSALISCAGCEISMYFGLGFFLSNAIGTALAAGYSDFMAHVLKVPATVMIIPGIVPLVPGGRLYYTMLGAVQSDMTKFSEYGKSVLLIAAGIAIGIISVTAISRPLNAKLNEYKQKRLAKGENK